MRQRFVALLAVAVVSASAVGCCCQTKKGFVFRGDWSLEMNRVPHMSSNGPQYQADCCDAGYCEESCGCPSGCTDGCVGGACGHHGSDASASYGGPGFARGARYMGDGMHAGYVDGEGRHMPPPPNPTPAANTRFHPVPTRPVFEQPIEAEAAAPRGEWVPAARGSKSSAVR